MGIKSTLIRPFARQVSKNILKDQIDAVHNQQLIFKELISKAKNTRFGKDHHFDKIETHQDFIDHVPIRDYEKLKPYFDSIVNGDNDVLWPGKPLYLAKTSGTTSGVKYIPLTKDSLPNHYGTAQKALFHYSHLYKKFDWADGKVIFLSGSPTLQQQNGLNIGRLSGIVNHQVPNWLKKGQLPSWETNCIEDWETKLDAIVEETYQKDLRLIGGIPPWVQMYFERLIAKTGKKTIKEIFPNFSVFVFGGVNYEPYRTSMEKLIGGSVDSIETYPASEGFIAFQDQSPSEGLLLNANSGIFFEFIPLDEVFNEKPTRLTIENIELNKDYAVIINSNAGLWGYNIGDTVRFVSQSPYRCVVSGRVKHFISAFGEHVIGKEVEQALLNTLTQFSSVKVTEFTVAPQVNPIGTEKPYHEWFIEFETEPDDLQSFSNKLDEELILQNIYYKDLIVGNILQPLKITPLKKGSFINYMKKQGKLGGQNKVPRLSNDRKIVEQL